MPTLPGMQILIAVVVTSALAITAVASESSDVVHESTHGSHPHHLGVSIGGATRWEDDHTTTGMSIGLDYEYRFDSHWGLGAVLETVGFTDDHRDLAFAIPVYWNPVSNLSLGAGPGFETDRDHVSFMMRFSASYSFHIGEFSFVPLVAVDLANGAQTVVYGFSIGRYF